MDKPELKELLSDLDYLVNLNKIFENEDVILLFNKRMADDEKIGGRQWYNYKKWNLKSSLNCIKVMLKMSRDYYEKEGFKLKMLKNINEYYAIIPEQVKNGS